MGWMRTLLLGDIGNRLDIADTEQNILALRNSLSVTTKNLYERDRQITKLKLELDQQKLAVQSLIRFLVDKGIIQESELNNFIREVDAEDGVVDGQIAIDTSKQRLVFTSTKKVDSSKFKATGDIESPK